MHMVMLAIELHQFCLEVFADVCENGSHGIQVFFIEHVAAILCNKDQMCVKRKYAMSTMP